MQGTHPARRRAGPAAAAQQSAITPQSAVGEKYFARDQRPIILFDGVCNLCNGGVNTLLQWDPSAVYRLAALQSTAGKALLKRSGRSPDDISSIVLVEEDQSYIKSEAILRIGRRLNVPFQVLGTMGLVGVPGFLRDAAYDAVANNRYNLFGKTSYCRLTDGKFSNRFIDT